MEKGEAKVEKPATFGSGLPPVAPPATAPSEKETDATKVKEAILISDGVYEYPED